LKIQQFKTLIVTAGTCSKCGLPLSRKNEGRAVTIVTQKRRRYIGQRFCLKHLPDEKKLKQLLTSIPGTTRKARIQKARDNAQAAGMREADLLDYCNRCGHKGDKCNCPGGPYFP
jgi:ribosomal protein L37E